MLEYMYKLKELKKRITSKNSFTYSVLINLVLRLAVLQFSTQLLAESNDAFVLLIMTVVVTAVSTSEGTNSEVYVYW